MLFSIRGVCHPQEIIIFCVKFLSLLLYHLHFSCMASLGVGANDKKSRNHIELPALASAMEGQDNQTKEIDYSQRAPWLRAAVLGANDGLVSVSSLMMGVGAAKEDIKAMLLAGFAGLVAGACSMAIGEFVSVYTQLDIERAQLERVQEANNDIENNEIIEKENLPNPLQAAAASALAFSVGAVVPLLAAVFITNYKIRVAVIVSVSSLTLLVFGAIGAILGKTSAWKASARVLIGGWMAMAITFGLTKLIGFTQL